MFQIVAQSIGDKMDPYNKKKPVYDQWEAYVETFKSIAPTSLHSIKQTSGPTWSFMITEKVFASSALQGIGIAMSFAFIILLLLTRSILLSLFAGICITSVIASVMAIMVLKGWALVSWSLYQW